MFNNAKFIFCEITYEFNDTPFIVEGSQRENNS